MTTFRSLSWFLSSIHLVQSALTYFGNGRSYTLWTGTQGECPILTNDGSKLYQCLTQVRVLEKLPWIISHVMQDNDPVYNHDFLLCRHQNNICRSILEYKDNLSPTCNKNFVGCQSALRHLQTMMFRPSGVEQQCNNFALKSIRAFFHDYMSSAIDGSLLSEMAVEMNVGLCRFSQYVNVLSDDTTCDPGSIIAMAGMLGFQACGVRLWELDQDVKPVTTIARGYTCAHNNNPKFINPATGQRFPQFDDIFVASNSTAMEEFWYLINGHNGMTFRPPDGEVEYSGEASGAAHVIGRVTCPITSKVDGVTVNVRTGFFHPNGANAVLKQPRGNAHEVMWNAEYFARDTQCQFNPKTNGWQVPPFKGLKNETYPKLGYSLNKKMTNFASEGGLCGMPTQFLHTVQLGGYHRIPRFMSILDNLGHNWPDSQGSPFTPAQCKIYTPMFIPWELLNLTSKPLPSSPALDRFVAIAWDGIGTVDSLWDGCSLECSNPIATNRLCSAQSASTIAPRLTKFNFYDTMDAPTPVPTVASSATPLTAPTAVPTPTSTTGSPSTTPTSSPSKPPTPSPTASTTVSPTVSRSSFRPSRKPTASSTVRPSTRPTSTPTFQPTIKTKKPSTKPTKEPNAKPTSKPTFKPSKK
mmetsp:Transcript_20821/g.28650  ORF Transcript_20821/g.28650 Transcript_20821/m.28650 type:complete len:638 (-) Transcript_20821:879-2792(-)